MGEDPIPISKRIKPEPLPEPSQCIENKIVSVKRDTTDRNAKATKADNAEAPVNLWNNILVPDGNPIAIRSLNLLRKACLKWWKKNIRRELINWMLTKHETCRSTFDSEFIKAVLKDDTGRKDLLAGRECVERFLWTPIARQQRECEMRADVVRVHHEMDAR